MSKKNTIAIIVILIVVAILGVIGYYVLSSNLWTEDGKIVQDGHANMIEKIKNIEDPQDKENTVKIFLEGNAITQAEADEILGK